MLHAFFHRSTFHPFLSRSLMLAAALAFASCNARQRGGATSDSGVDGGNLCDFVGTSCSGKSFLTCAEVGQIPTSMLCAGATPACDPTRGCLPCLPNGLSCEGDNLVRCNADGTQKTVETDCSTQELSCVEGRCVDPCEVLSSSYVGCEFYAVDLDNVAIDSGSDASSQQFAVVVSNLNSQSTLVWIEIDDAAYGAAPTVRRLQEFIVPANDVETFLLPRREVDGSSSNRICTTEATCDSGELCDCPSRPCRCRVRAGANGYNDGTHSALSAKAFRIRSNRPIVAYQFNPLDNVRVFSNDASLLLPVNGLGTTYTVNSWPQTIADSSNPDEDFNPSQVGEDLRSFMTVVGTGNRSSIEITLGPNVKKVVGIGEYLDPQPGQVLQFELGAFEVLNLETQGFRGDFSGSVVQAQAPVAVFVGSEASDAPFFERMADRRCCADHLEEQSLPDQTLGRAFVIARTPARTTALNRALLGGDRVAMVDEPEYVRIVATQNDTVVRTNLLPPNDSLRLAARESVTVNIQSDVILDSNHPISVLQAQSSQEVTGIPNRYPGGDPSILFPPPTEQMRTDYVFLTPASYAFDFVTITAPEGVEILFDNAPLSAESCAYSPVAGTVSGSRWVVYRCQLGFPTVRSSGSVVIEPGQQGDGYHSIQAAAPVGVVITGFDAFVSYAYTAGLDLKPLL